MPVYILKPGYSTNGSIFGQWADYIIEDDTANAGEWPDLSPVTMTGSAFVVQGTGASPVSTWVTTTTDPYVSLQTDATAATPRGDGHLIITVPTGAVKWTDAATNVYYWNGSNFNSFAPGCAFSIGVGPNSQGLTNGTPWITDCPSDHGGKDFADGNRNVWQMQTDGFWVKMQDDIATQVEVSPEGIAWAINWSGNILYWNGSQFVESPASGLRAVDWRRPEFKPADERNSVVCRLSPRCGRELCGVPNGDRRHRRISFDQLGQDAG